MRTILLLTLCVLSACSRIDEPDMQAIQQQEELYALKAQHKSCHGDQHGAVLRQAKTCRQKSGYYGTLCFDKAIVEICDDRLTQ